MRPIKWTREGNLMGFASIHPTSNDPPRPSDKKNPWLGDNPDAGEDLTFLVVSGRARKCAGPCGRTTNKKHLDDQGRCPDCRS